MAHFPPKKSHLFSPTVWYRHQMSSVITTETQVPWDGTIHISISTPINKSHNFVQVEVRGPECSMAEGRCVTSASVDWDPVRILLEPLLASHLTPEPVSSPGRANSRSKWLRPLSETMPFVGHAPRRPWEGAPGWRVFKGAHCWARRPRVPCMPPSTCFSAAQPCLPAPSRVPRRRATPCRRLPTAHPEQDWPPRQHHAPISGK